MPLPWKPWRYPRCALGSLISDLSFSRASSRRQPCSAKCRGPTSRNGGQSSSPRASGQSETAIRSRFAAWSVPKTYRIRLVNASAYSIGLPRGHFDVVHCQALLDHLRQSSTQFEKWRPSRGWYCYLLRLRFFDFSGSFFSATAVIAALGTLILALK